MYRGYIGETPSEAGIIPVKLKRKVEYKNTHKYQYVSVPKVLHALQTLKDLGHKYYHFVPDIVQFKDKCRESDVEGFNLIFPNDVNSDIDHDANTTLPASVPGLESIPEEISQGADTSITDLFGESNDEEFEGFSSQASDILSVGPKNYTEHVASNGDMDVSDDYSHLHHFDDDDAMATDSVDNVLSPSHMPYPDDNEDNVKTMKNKVKILTLILKR